MRQHAAVSHCGAESTLTVYTGALYVDSVANQGQRIGDKTRQGDEEGEKKALEAI